MKKLILLLALAAGALLSTSAAPAFAQNCSSTEYATHPYTFLGPKIGGEVVIQCDASAVAVHIDNYILGDNAGGEWGIYPNETIYQTVPQTLNYIDRKPTWVCPHGGSYWWSATTTWEVKWQNQQYFGPPHTTYGPGTPYACA